MMVGRTVYEATPELPETPDPTVMLEVRHLNRGRQVRDISFSLHRGEVLGIAGLVGAGRTEVVRAIFAADLPESGEILVNGKPVTIRTPADAVRHGIAYLSEDRKRYGLALGMDVETNAVLASLGQFTNRFGWVKTAATRRKALELIETLAIKTPRVTQRVKNLSGGNQQKVVIAKWLIADTDILIFDEPTRGIDVGAKSEIYKLAERPRSTGQGRDHDQLGAAGDPAHEPPDPRHVRGTDHRRAGIGRGDAGADHDARDAARLGGRRMKPLTVVVNPMGAI